MAVEVLIGEADLAARVAELATMIRRDYGAGTPVHLVAVLKGAFVFLADLVRVMDGPVTCDFVALSSYGEGNQSSGEVKLVKGLDHPLEGRDVLIVEDIADSGLTLAYLQDALRAERPRSLRTVCLLNKPSRRTKEVRIDYVGFTIPDKFVVGYGLDFNQMHRNLPYVGILEGGA